MNESTPTAQTLNQKVKMWMDVVQAPCNVKKNTHSVDFCNIDGSACCYRNCPLRWISEEKFNVISKVIQLGTEQKVHEISSVEQKEA